MQDTWMQLGDSFRTRNNPLHVEIVSTSLRSGMCVALKLRRSCQRQSRRSSDENHFEARASDENNFEARASSNVHLLWGLARVVLHNAIIIVLPIVRTI